jgi:hypothetical protein
MRLKVADSIRFRAAPQYLHNGSVLSLAELLKPAAGRVAAFKIGPAYVSTMSDLRSSKRYSGTLDSGNNRCGHDFGTKLLLNQKKPCSNI